MIVKTLVIIIIINFIKAIGLLISIILWLINKESEDILKTKRENICIRPTIFIEMPETMTISSLMHNKYKNKVFDLTYMKILLGRDRFWIKMLILTINKNTVKNIFFIILGINRLLINFLYIVLKNDWNSLKIYIYNKTVNPVDSRIIMKINERWEINGTKEKIISFIELNLQNKISRSNFNLISPLIYKKIEILEKKITEIDHETKTFRGLFVEKTTKMHHKVFIEMPKSDRYYGYETDLLKAAKNNYYGLTPLIEYKGTKKDSVLIKINSNEMIPKTEMKKESALAIYYGGISNGYNPTEINDKHVINMKKIETIENEFIEELNNIGFDESDSKRISKQVIELIIKSNNNTIDDIINTNY